MTENLKSITLRFPSDSHGDMTVPIQEAVNSVPDSSHILFSKGIYRFSHTNAQRFTCSLSNSDPSDSHCAGLILEGRKNLILDGQGSTLLCHGQMLPILLRDCENIILQNFTIDWDIPLTAEGTVIRSEENYVDVRVDSTRYPFHIQDQQLWFDGGDWSQKLCLWGHTEFDTATGKLAWHRGDRFPTTTQSLLKNGDIRFSGDFSDRQPTPGNILVLRHGDRIHSGILIHHCQNITVQNLNMHSNGGLGILSQFSDTLTFSHVNIVPNRKAGRLFASGHDDGLHLSAVSGQITVEDCSFLGLMDDPLNLHGIAAGVKTQTDAHSFLGYFAHPQSKGHDLWAEPGQTVALLDGRTMEELCRATVKDYTLLDQETFRITFYEEISLDCPSLSLENMSRTASLTCRRNHFGACRARGLLVCTPKPVLIEDNLFESGGAAIRIPGDVCTWYESGRCRDVTIRRNFFSDSCLMNDYQGGQGIISISPELPCPSSQHPCHQNIRITDNTFLTSDSRILYALCTENLQFTGNRIIKSHAYPENIVTDSPVTLEHCTGARIEGNHFIG